MNAMLEGYQFGCAQACWRSRFRQQQTLRQRMHKRFPPDKLSALCGRCAIGEMEAETRKGKGGAVGVVGGAVVGAV